MINRKLIAIIFAVLVTSLGGLGIKLYFESNAFNDLSSKYVDVTKQYESTKKTLLGYTKFTSYSAVLSKSMSEQMKFSAFLWPPWN